MQQQDLFQALIDGGYVFVPANLELRGDKRFIFMGKSVSLGQQPEEEASNVTNPTPNTADAPNEGGGPRDIFLEVDTGEDPSPNLEPSNDDIVRANERLVNDAVAILEKYGGRMRQKDFFARVADLGYHRFSLRCREGGRFVFIGMDIKLLKQPEEEG